MLVSVGVTVLLVVILVLVSLGDDPVGDVGTPGATTTAPATGGWSGAD